MTGVRKSQLKASKWVHDTYANHRYRSAELLNLLHQKTNQSEEEAWSVVILSLQPLALNALPAVTHGSSIESFKCTINAHFKKKKKRSK